MKAARTKNAFKMLRPKEEEETVLVQAHLRKDLHEQMRAHLDAFNLSWTEAITQLVEAVLEERKRHLK